MNFLYYKKRKTGKTGRELVKRLRIRSQRSVERGLVSPHRINKIIRWGTTETFGENEECMELNTCHAVMNSSNKIKSLQLMKEADVSVPWFTDNRETATEYNKNFPIVGRTTNHQGGSNFRVTYPTTFPNLTNDRLSSHWLELIPIHKEWRVHVFRGEVIGVSRKTDEGVEHRITNRLTRNHSNGWRFIRCDLDFVQDRLKEIAIEAIKALSLDFGAVDIILSTGEENNATGRKYYVLEVNSAPSLESNSTIIEKYIGGILKWIRSTQDC